MERFASLLLAICAAFLTTANSANTVIDSVQIEVLEEVYYNAITIYDSSQKDAEVNKCEIKSNEESASFSKYYPPPTENIRFEKDRYEPQCSIGWKKLKVEDSGVWKVRSHFRPNTTIETTLHLYVKKKLKAANLIPKKEMWVSPSQTVSAGFEQNYEDVKSCFLVNPKKTEGFNLTELSANAPIKLKSLDRCEFEMTIGMESEGEWSLYADANNSITYKASLRINVLKDEFNELKTIHTVLKMGHKESEICVDKHESIVTCSFEDPLGKIYQAESRFCKTISEPVTKYHGGTWTARCNVAGITHIVEQEIFVQIKGLETVQASVENMKDGAINVLCKISYKGKSPVKSCNFVKPNGEVLPITVGMGHKNYAYYGTGDHYDSYNLQGIFQCGLTIHKPSVTEDYGNWICLSVIGSQTFGRIVKVAPQDSAVTDVGLMNMNVATADDIYVKSGSPYKVKCSVNEILNYCYLLSPNGTRHPVVRSENITPPALNYTGAGFELGDCTADVKVAEESHVGKWSCHMGTVDGIEHQINFNVELKETDFMAVESRVASDEKRTPRFTCRTLPESTNAIKSCQWMSPAGYGINGAHFQGRFNTSTNATHCELSIIKVIHKEDLGKWTCYATLFDVKGTQVSVEARDYIVFHPEGSSSTRFISISLNVTIGLAVFICFLVLFVRYKKRFLVHPDKDVFFEKPSESPEIMKC